jgi:hypothetical protein
MRGTTVSLEVRQIGIQLSVGDAGLGDVQPLRTDRDVSSEGEASDERKPIYVMNAGLVLITPYLPALFERVGLLTADAEGRLSWVKPEAAERGIHLVQYLADARIDAPEPLLALNKVLCGLDPSWLAPPAIELTDVEEETCASLLDALIAAWRRQSGSSASALRETFFQREGRLRRADSGWQLEVERKALDVLLDNLPWSFSTILHPWMPEPLSVSW